MSSLWALCLGRLEDDLSPQQFNTWIRPLQAIEESTQLRLLAPNQFVKDFVSKEMLDEISKLIGGFRAKPISVEIEIGGGSVSQSTDGKHDSANVVDAKSSTPKLRFEGRLNPVFTFDSHIGGKSNQLARAAAKQVGENPGKAYNPLFLYGGVGLGKTHLMQAAGNLVVQNNSAAKVVYVHSERFVADMVKALQHNSINDFKRYYRSLDALLIDDIQFFSGKEHSQEEFFHTFNALLDQNNQMILTCDKYPKEIDGLEDRLKSRLGWGLPVVIDPPELETRAAVLLKKASLMGVDLPSDCAIYIAQRIRSNIRELEGALKRVSANSKFTNQPIDLSLVKDALKDLFVISAKMVSIENIQKTVSEYYNIKLSDLLSKRRSRSITRPRQLAMALTKELTNHSLPEIGEAFNGRDHTTVLHACKKIAELRKEDPSQEEDYRNLNRALTN